MSALFDLACDQGCAPEQSDQKWEDEEQHACRDEGVESADELLEPRTAYFTDVRDEFGTTEGAHTAVQSGIGKRVIHRQAARNHQRGEQRETDHGGQGSLAVLAPREPDHAGTPQATWLPTTSPSAR